MLFASAVRCPSELTVVVILSFLSPLFLDGTTMLHNPLFHLILGHAIALIKVGEDSLFTHGMSSGNVEDLNMVHGLSTQGCEQGTLQVVPWIG
jgi:hypothetical protein